MNTPPTGTTPTTAVAPAVPPPAPATDTTAAVAEQKADAKASADATVATDPTAIHAVQTIATSGKALGSTATGAVAGLMIAGPPGALVGAGAGWIVEKYRIAGGPFGKVSDWVKAKWAAHKAAKAAGGTGQ